MAQRLRLVVDPDVIGAIEAEFMLTVYDAAVLRRRRLDGHAPPRREDRLPPRCGKVPSHLGLQAARLGPRILGKSADS